MDVTGMDRRCALPTLHGIDLRLCRRYSELFLTHLSSTQRVAAGFHASPTAGKPFAATQAAWRFFNNDTVTLPVLARPLLECARQEIPLACDQWLLVPMDWCHLSFGLHHSKAHRKTFRHQNVEGYELMTALAVSDRDGATLAPLCLELIAGNGVHSTRSPTPLPVDSALDTLLPVMDHINGELSKSPGNKPAVFIIDREADSVGHFRRWDLRGQRFVVRANDRPLVLYNSRQMALREVADSLKKAGAFTFARLVDYKGKPGQQQFVAEAQVVMKRTSVTNRVDRKTGKTVKKRKAGPPLTLRLVVSEVRDDQGKVLARWLLLTNLPASVNTATVALWYYWRWRIESYHKLLKGAGQHVEQWQQETPEALARRLTVAAMACVVVWKLARDDSEPAAQLRDVLVKLSGRQIKRGKDRRTFTEPALLAGLGILIPMLLLLEQYDLEELRKMTEALLPGLLQKSVPKPERRDV
jgi:hypothetical protein